MKWQSSKLHQHPAPHQSACGLVELSDAGVYGLRVGNAWMSCPPDWAAKIHAAEEAAAVDEARDEFATTRKFLGLTQTQAAELCGVRTAEAVAHWEAGRRRVPESALKLIRIAAASAH